MPEWFGIEHAVNIKQIQEKKGESNNVDNHNKQSGGQGNR